MTHVTGASLRRKIGSCLGAIGDIPSLMLRVEVDEDTGCWMWAGNVIGVRDTVPKAYFRDGSNGSVPRWAYQQVNGPIPRAWVVWRTCECQRCVNPAHMKAGTRKQWGNWIKSTGSWAGDIARVAWCRKGASSRMVLTPEVIADMRDRGETPQQAAARLGVRAASVYRAIVRTQHVEGASVFSWRPQ